MRACLHFLQQGLAEETADAPLLLNSSPFVERDRTISFRPANQPVEGKTDDVKRAHLLSRRLNNNALDRVDKVLGSINSSPVRSTVGLLSNTSLLPSHHPRTK